MNIRLTAQCTPPWTETCKDAMVLCSLSELNGFACNNPGTVPLGCPTVRTGFNTSWWAFVTHGGTVSISLIVGSCSSNQGLAYGIMGDCSCGEEVITRQNPCIFPNSIDSIQLNLKPCKTYYLWVDGCQGSICDFTLNTRGDKDPPLIPFGKINHDTIGTVCAGSCNVHFFVDLQPNACELTYQWTLDGDEVGENSNESNLDFPDEGDFVLCVTAFTGNPQNGSICDQEGPVCTIIKVRTMADKKDTIARILCYETVFPLGFKWHSQRITQSGIYREQFTNGNCCKFDSIVEFQILKSPVTVEVFHITCDSTPYIDSYGRSWYGCQNKYPITLQKSTTAYQCDSTILLTSAFLSYNPIWEVHCNYGDMEINLFDDIGPNCDPIDSVITSYSWYDKADPNKTILSKINKLKVHSMGTYCTIVDIDLTSHSKQQAKCSKTVCYELKTDSLFASFNQLGTNKLCIDEIGIFHYDTSNTGGTKYEWSSDGNPAIHSTDTVFNKEILLSWHQPGINTICVRSYFGQNASCLICQKVEVIKAANAGRDLKVLGYQTKMKTPNVESAKWKLISGPGKASFSNSFDPNTRISVTKLGHYVFELTATLRGCMDKDTIAIDFFKLPMFNSYPNHFNEEADSEFIQLSKRNKTESTIDLFTPNLIPSNGITFIKLAESISFKELEFSWMDISGKIIIKRKIQSESCTSNCEIPSPVSTGMYFLFLKFDDQKIVRKIIVMD